MSKAAVHRVLLAGPHHAMSEAIRDLLATTFGAVVMVADDVSLFESAGRLESDVAVVDLALARGEGLDFVRRLHARFPSMKVIIIGGHDDASVSESVLGAGADAYVVKSKISTDLLAAADAVLAGRRYVSPQADRGATPA
jgi:DNA-binding NarL/FixJ family response regulator